MRAFRGGEVGDGWDGVCSMVGIQHEGSMGV